jgi:hypothetical protein
MYMFICTINEGCTRTIYIARHALINHKPQNIFIRYLHIYLSSLQHLLNNFNRYFFASVEKYQRGEKFLFVEKKKQGKVWDIHTKDFLLLVSTKQQRCRYTAIRTHKRFKLAFFCIVS